MPHSLRMGATFLLSLRILAVSPFCCAVNGKYFFEILIFPLDFV